MSWVETLGGWPALIGYILGLIGIVATVIAYFRTKLVKTLDWDLILSSPLVASFTSAPSVVVTVDGDALDEPSVSIVRILNSGRLAIDRDEWDGPITIALKNGFRKASVVSRSDEAVASNIIIGPRDGDANVAELTNVGLLNPQDSFDVQFISEHEPGEPICQARFTGRTRPMRKLSTYRVPETIGQVLSQAVKLSVSGTLRL